MCIVRNTNWCKYHGKQYGVSLKKLKIALPIPFQGIYPNKTKTLNQKYTCTPLSVKPEAPILWPPNAKSRFTGKDPDAGRG